MLHLKQKKWSLSKSQTSVLYRSCLVRGIKKKTGTVPLSGEPAGGVLRIKSARASREVNKRDGLTTADTHVAAIVLLH